jgi:hypothetical protein
VVVARGVVAAVTAPIVTGRVVPTMPAVVTARAIGAVPPMPGGAVSADTRTAIIPGGIVGPVPPVLTAHMAGSVVRAMAALGTLPPRAYPIVASGRCQGRMLGRSVCPDVSDGSGLALGGHRDARAGDAQRECDGSSGEPDAGMSRCVHDRVSWLSVRAQSWAHRQDRHGAVGTATRHWS